MIRARTATRLLLARGTRNGRHRHRPDLGLRRDGPEPGEDGKKGEEWCEARHAAIERIRLGRVKATRRDPPPLQQAFQGQGPASGSPPCGLGTSIVIHEELGRKLRVLLVKLHRKRGP